MNYNIDFNKQVTAILPSFKRKIKRISWLYRLLAFIRSIHDSFLSFNGTVDNDLKYAPGYKIQVEQMLIDKFGAGITITNNLQNVRPYFAFEVNNLSNKFSFLRNSTGNLFTYETDKYNFNHKNFTVDVPAALNADLSKMKALISRYNRVGMNFEIIES